MRLELDVSMIRAIPIHDAEVFAVTQEWKSAKNTYSESCDIDVRIRIRIHDDERLDFLGDAVLEKREIDICFARVSEINARIVEPAAAFEAMDHWTIDCKVSSSAPESHASHVRCSNCIHRLVFISGSEFQIRCEGVFLCTDNPDIS